MPAIKTITLKFITRDGVELEPVSFELADGKSAYEVFKELPGNETKTEEEFFDFLRMIPNLAQTTGNSTEAVMSQKAVTDALKQAGSTTVKLVQGAATFTLNRTTNSHVVVFRDAVASTSTLNLNGSEFELADELTIHLLGPTGRTLRIINTTGKLLGPDGTSSADVGVASTITGISTVKILKLDGTADLQIVQVGGL